MRRSALFVGLLGVGLLCGALLAGEARAEEVAFLSGARYDATEVTFVGETDVRFTFRVGGGTATVTAPWERLEPWSAFALRASRTKPLDAKGQLALGKFALARGLGTEAERRFRKAALLDPTLAPESAAGLLDVRDAALLATLDAAMLDLRRGRGDLALEKAKDVLGKASPDSLPATRAKTLVEVSESVAARDAARRAADEAEREASAAKAASEALTRSLGKSDEQVRVARERRESAADPTRSVSGAVFDLEKAETALREARHVLRLAFDAAGDRVPEVEVRERAAKDLLVRTHVDLADLYRQERRFDRARDRVRAALILAPEDVLARDVRDLVEADVRQPPPEPYSEPYGFTSGWYGYGGILPSYPVVVGPRWYGSGLGPWRAPRYPWTYRTFR